MRSRHNTDERSETIDINCIPPETSGCDPVSPKKHFSIGLTCTEQSAKTFWKKLMKFHVLNYNYFALFIFVGKCNIWLGQFLCNDTIAQCTEENYECAIIFVLWTTVQWIMWIMWTRVWFCQVLLGKRNPWKNHQDQVYIVQLKVKSV